jgi:DNA repair exonuclease SbcCD ATPase subunit
MTQESDIIERLTTEIRDGKSQSKEAIRELRAEIERLQGHMRALADTSVDRDTAGIFKGMWQGSERECEQLRAEIERLRGENAELKAALTISEARAVRESKS